MPTSIDLSRLDVIENPAPCKASDKILFLLLPGAYDGPGDFIKHGFIDIVRERSIAADLILADAHAAYYGDGLIVPRLHSDIILPALQKGYQKIWLAGISLGGNGTLQYLMQHGDLIDGAFLIAPFLGNRTLHAQIAQAGGLIAWQAENNIKPDDDMLMWSWLKTKSRQAEAHENRGENTGRFGKTEIHLGFGLQDRFAASNALLADILPDAHVTTLDGAHDWPTWRALWGGFFDRNSFPKCE